jgi:cytochrome c-type biogenesis protein
MTETLATPTRSPRRTWIAAGVTLAILTVTITAGLLFPADGGVPVIFLERLSARIGRVASEATGGLWWTYAFLLGAVAAFNPCGFGLLPAYLGLYLKNGTLEGRAARARRALAVGGVVAAAFALVFGVASLLFSIGFLAISSLLVGLLPWFGLGVGVLLVVAGGVGLSGRSLSWTITQRVAGHLGQEARSPGAGGYAAFGLGYGLASLGCTLPLFLALVGTATAFGGLGSALGAFALYGAGMATTLAVLALVTSLAGVGIVTRGRTVARFVPGLGAVLLLLSGAYVVYYWLTAGRLLLT